MPHERKINSTAPELFYEALSTLDINVIEGNAHFLVNAFSRPQIDGLDEITEYLQFCRAKGIMPYSILSTAYDGQGDLDTSLRTFIKRPDTATLETLLLGGRAEKVEVELNPNGYHHFRTEYLPRLVKMCDYSIVYAKIILADYSTRVGSSISTQADITVTIRNFGRDNGVRLSIKTDLAQNQEKVIKAKRWFARLVRNYANP